MSFQVIKGKRILVVDDEPLCRDLLRVMLESDSHSVVEASDGAEAWELIRKNSFDLVITDLNMPGMRGDQLAALIKQRDPMQPIILTKAAIPADFDPGKCMADIILEKIWTFSDLREAIARLLEGQD